MELKEIFDKVRPSFNNSAEAWNKGLTVDYTIFSHCIVQATYNTSRPFVCTSCLHTLWIT